ncbi:MAG: hypothetical protein V3T05_03715 [Myxococcota bacterium]
MTVLRALRTVFAFAAAMSLTACGADSATPRPDTLDLSSEAMLRFDVGERLLEPVHGTEIDMRLPGRTYLFNEEAPHWDPTDIEVIFPGGTRRSLKRWLWSQAQEAGIDVAHNDTSRFFLSGLPIERRLMPDEIPGVGEEYEDCQIWCVEGSFETGVCGLRCSDLLLEPPGSDSCNPFCWFPYWTWDPWVGDGHTDPPPGDGHTDPAPGGSSGGSSGGSAGGSSGGSSGSGSSSGGSSGGPSGSSPGMGGDPAGDGI